MKTLLILGEHGDDDLNKNIGRLQRYSRQIGLSTRTMSYEQLLARDTGKIGTEDLSVMFFFPFKFWNDNCEVPEDTSLYGTSKTTYERFKQFWQDVAGTVGTTFADRRISYIIDPTSAAIDRDKTETHDILEAAKVSTTSTLPRDIEQILETAETQGVFIKSRYGALGKGITYVSPNGWSTNYKINTNGKLENHPISSGQGQNPRESKWNFVDITGNRDILQRILDLEMIVEKEVVPPKIRKNKKFDIRIYTVFGQAPHMFFRENDPSNLVTNFCQGGVINPEYGELLTEDTKDLARREALKAAQALKSKFLGVDVIFDTNLETPRVLEVQTFTGYPLIRQFNLSKYLAEEIKAA